MAVAALQLDSQETLLIYLNLRCCMKFLALLDDLI